MVVKFRGVRVKRPEGFDKTRPQAYIEQAERDQEGVPSSYAPALGWGRFGRPGGDGGLKFPVLGENGALEFSNFC